MCINSSVNPAFKVLTYCKNLASDSNHCTSKLACEITHEGTYAAKDPPSEWVSNLKLGNNTSTMPFKL